MGWVSKDGNMVWVNDQSYNSGVTTQLSPNNPFTNLAGSYYNSSLFDNVMAGTKAPPTNPTDFWGWQDTMDFDAIGQSPENLALFGEQQAAADTAFNASSPVKFDRDAMTISGKRADVSLFNKENAQTNPFSDMTTGDWFTAAQQGANAIGSLYNIYQGNKMLGLYQDQFDFNKKLSKTNLFNQAQTVNAEMSDRQRMRNSMGAGLSTEDYMKKYGVRGKM